MVIAPNMKLMESISLVMARAVQDLHKLIETKCNPEKPIETMVLMMGFTTGIILQLRAKLETLEAGLGSKFLDSVNSATQNGSKGLDTIEKLQRDDPSLEQSSSGISPTDPLAAITFLAGKINHDLANHLEELPLVLRNDATLSHALAMLIANLFYELDHRNIDASINALMIHIRRFVRVNEQKVQLHN